MSAPREVWAVTDIDGCLGGWHLNPASAIAAAKESDIIADDLALHGVERYIHESALAAVERERERYRERAQSNEAQLVWLSDWCRRVTGVDTNAVIGKNGYPNTLAECVAQAVEARSDARHKALREIRAVVNAQAEDDGLWFVAQTAAEAYLQAELRRLHAVIESHAPGCVAAI